MSWHRFLDECDNCNQPVFEMTFHLMPGEVTWFDLEPVMWPGKVEVDGGIKSKAARAKARRYLQEQEKRRPFAQSFAKLDFEKGLFELAAPLARSKPASGLYYIRHECKEDDHGHD